MVLFFWPFQKNNVQSYPRKHSPTKTQYSTQARKTSTNTMISLVANVINTPLNRKKLLTTQPKDLLRQQRGFKTNTALKDFLLERYFIQNLKLTGEGLRTLGPVICANPIPRKESNNYRDNLNKQSRNRLHHQQRYFDHLQPFLQQ